MICTETVQLDEKEIQEAIREWWQKRYTPFGTFSITLHHQAVTTGMGVFEADHHTYSATIVRTDDKKTP
jgi:predicted RNA binding protein with dsRBD fold (UPF0201 family)